MTTTRNRRAADERLTLSATKSVRNAARVAKRRESTAAMALDLDAFADSATEQVAQIYASHDDALRETERVARAAGNKVEWIPLSDIGDSMHQPRIARKGEKLQSAAAAKDEALKASIARLGIFQLPEVRANEWFEGSQSVLPFQRTRYHAVFGHRRIDALRALASEGRTEADNHAELVRDGAIQVVVTTCNRDEVRWRTLTENMSRVGLSPWEQVVAVRDLLKVDDDGAKFLTVDELAILIGEDRSSTGRIRYIVQHLTTAALVEAGMISPALVSVPEFSDLPTNRRSYLYLPSWQGARDDMLLLSMAALHRVASEKYSVVQSRILSDELRAAGAPLRDDGTRPSERRASAPSSGSNELPRTEVRLSYTGAAADLRRAKALKLLLQLKDPFFGLIARAAEDMDAVTREDFSIRLRQADGLVSQQRARA